jgi:hypothetical protein
VSEPDYDELIFGPKSEDEKIECFEESTLRLVLLQIGWTSGQVARTREEIGPNFGWDWFNDLNLTGVTRVGSTRIFRFNFDELLTKPASHPITKAFSEFSASAGVPCCLVFRVADRGRWVATTCPVDYDTCIRVVTDDLTYSVLPFTAFFQKRWRPSDD